jgi:putative tryptophan/tyrosine transport system substrate-binding protein
MSANMKRREFVMLVGGVAITWPQRVLSEGHNRPPVIAWLWFGSPGGRLPERYGKAFAQGMRERGYTQGQDFILAYRYAEGRADRMPGLVAELLELGPDVFIAPTTFQAVAASRATTTVPIVIPVFADPVGSGLVASEARPGGNVTGIAPYVKGLPAKQLELAREIVPNAKRIGLLDDVNDPKSGPQRREIEGAAQSLNVAIVTAEARTTDDIRSAFQMFATEHTDVVIVEQSNMLISAGIQIAEAAATKKLPAVYGYREHVEAGGLISYGVDLNGCFHRAAYYVDRILKGAKPADLPVEFPTRLELVINIKVAKSLNVEIPPTLLARADEVIE